MVEMLYRGGKGDYLEGGVRVSAMAWWPGMIEAQQTLGDIIHETDLFTTRVPAITTVRSPPGQDVTEKAKSTRFATGGFSVVTFQVGRVRSEVPWSTK